MTWEKIRGQPGAIVTADFNGDGQPDLAVSEPCEALPGCNTQSTGNVKILLGRPDGTFFVASTVAVSNLPTALATGDFNGDGKIDIAVANYGANDGDDPVERWARWFHSGSLDGTGGPVAQLHRCGRL